MRRSNMPRAPEHEGAGEERQTRRPGIPKAPEAETLNEKYRKALDAVEEKGMVAIKLLESGDVKYRLVLRRTQRGVIHTLEIMEAGADRPAVRIDLLGNFQHVLDSADRVLSEMSMDDFRQVRDMLLSLRRQQRRGRDVEEI